ncbi:MAG TPA: PAS domain-containing protein [Candidatus Dormibacteraeota bacterium]|nr:PAS domain-containing protein [Candidatus Dormibacteraeota bacterium]
MKPSFTTEFRIKSLPDGKPANGSLTHAAARPDRHADEGLVLSDAALLLETLLDNSPDAIYFKDRQSRFVHSSRSLAKIFNLSSATELLGKTDADFFAPEHANEAFQDEQDIMRTGRPIIGKLEKEVHPDGRVSWALTSKMPWRDQNGNIAGIFGISKNVTALKEAEQNLAHEQQLLRTLLDNLPDCIFFKDRDSRFVITSKSKVEKTLQRSPKLRELNATGEIDCSMLNGLSDYDMFNEEHARHMLEDEQRILSTGAPLVDKLEKQPHLDGSVTWALCTKMPWRDRDGSIIGTFGVSRDITALKQTEADLAAAHKRLLEASRLAGMAEVATDVLHNVGNTLNSINVSCAVITARVEQRTANGLAKIPEMLRQNRGNLEAFLTSDERGKQLPDFIEAFAGTFDEEKRFLLNELRQLRKHIEHINQIVSMQQSYAKVAGVCDVIDLAQLIDDAIQINGAALERHQIVLRKEIAPLPSVIIDKHKVLQILVNLISNAKYALTETRNTEKSLLIRAKPTEQSKLKIEVTDNGVGIPAENLTRIFAHGFTTRHSGHGFGLHSGALAARELGGSLTATSAGVGMGATFTLLLPLKAPGA